MLMCMESGVCVTLWVAAMLSMAGIVCLICRNCEQYILDLYGMLGVLSYVVNFFAAEHGKYGLSFMWKAVE